MLPGMELMGCTGLAVPGEVMHHVVRVESSYNPFAIGVVGGRLARQPQTLAEAVSTSRMLEREGYNFSLGLAQVNRHNLARHGLDTHEQAFDVCPNLRAGARILADCHSRAGGDWGKAFSCYYSGNFVTGFQHGYVQKVLASWKAVRPADAISVLRTSSALPAPHGGRATSSRVERRVQEAAPARQTTATAERIRADTGGDRRDAPAPVSASGVPPPIADAADAPVTVQLTAAPASPSARPSPSTPDATAAQGRDAAFVF